MQKKPKEGKERITTITMGSLMVLAAAFIINTLCLEAKTPNIGKAKATLASILDNTPDSITTTKSPTIFALLIITDEEYEYYKRIQKDITRLKKEWGTPENNIMLLTPQDLQTSGEGQQPSKAEQVRKHVVKRMKPGDRVALFVEGRGHKHVDIRTLSSRNEKRKIK